MSTVEELEQLLQEMSDRGEDVTDILNKITNAKMSERLTEEVQQQQQQFDHAEIQGFSIRELCAGDLQYELLSIYFRSKMEVDAERYLRQISQLELEIRESEHVVRGLKGEISQANLERDQALQYRNAAVSQVEEKDQEIANLVNEIADLKKEIALGNKKPTVTNLDGGGDYAKQLAEQIRASQTPVLGIIQANNKGSEYLITHVDGTQEVIPWLNKGKYRVVDEEEAARFRTAQTVEPITVAADASESQNSDTSDQALELDFPTEEAAQENDADGISGIQPDANADHHAGSGEDRAHGSAEPLEALAERLARLEERVSTLELIAG
jgi:uncharacterized protein YoxC